MATTRRHFLATAAGAGLLAAQNVSPNARVRIALIGAGVLALVLAGVAVGRKSVPAALACVVLLGALVLRVRPARRHPRTPD